MLFSNLILKFLFYCFILYTVLLYARYDMCACYHSMAEIYDILRI